MSLIKVCLLVSMVFCLGNCIPGGRMNVNLNDPNAHKQVKELANFALNTITNMRRKERENEKLNFKLIRIVSAQKQVVAGVNYFITFRLRDSLCRYASKCAAEQCDVKIFRSLNNETKLTEHSCQVQRGREVNIVGGRTNDSTDKKEVQDAVKFAVKDLNMNSDKENYFKLFDIKSVQTQVVSGMNYFIKISIGETNCKKSNGLENEQNCMQLSGKNKIECEVGVNHRPWIQPAYKIIRSDCVL